MDRLMSMRAFQKVVEEGGFAAAARALDMSPAVVTRLIADLEGHLGTRLLHRTTRRLSLSVAGEIYASRVRAILQDIDEAHSAASSQTLGLAGVVRVLSPPVLATYVLGPMLAQFRRLHPRIWLDVDVASFDEPPIEDYDLTLMRTGEAFDGDIIARKISTTEAILVCTPEYLARRGTPSTPQDLAGHETLRMKAPGQRSHVWRLFNAERADEILQLTIEPAIWINHSDSLLRATLAGAGITSIPLDLAAPYLTQGELVRVLRPWISGRLSLYAALPSRKFMPERTRVFLDFLVEWIRDQQSSALQACTNC
jgi:DNA-binding transcriptional LysR family regulator